MMVIDGGFSHPLLRPAISWANEALGGYVMGPLDFHELIVRPQIATLFNAFVNVLRSYGKSSSRRLEKMYENWSRLGHLDFFYRCMYVHIYIYTVYGVSVVVILDIYIYIYILCVCVFIYIYIYMKLFIYPQTKTFADPETHPLHGFVPFWPDRVLAFGRLFSLFWALTASVHTWNMSASWKSSCSRC